MPQNTRIVFAFASLFCFSFVVIGQDQSEATRTAKMERLVTENQKLRSQVVAMSQETGV